MSLPILSLEAFLTPSTTAEKRAAASALASACQTHGFFYLSTDHIPAALQQRVLSLARTFFLTTPAAQKSSLARLNPGHGGDGVRGYQRLRENITAGHADYHEALDFYRPVTPELFDPARPELGYKLLKGVNLWPDVAGFREAFEEYWAGLRELGAAAMTAIAWALGYEDDEEVLGRVTREGFWIARAIGYPPLETEGAGVSCGVHAGWFFLFFV